MSKFNSSMSDEIDELIIELERLKHTATEHRMEHDNYIFHMVTVPFLGKTIGKLQAILRWSRWRRKEWQQNAELLKDQEDKKND